MVALGQVMFDRCRQWTVIPDQSFAQRLVHPRRLYDVSRQCPPNRSAVSPDLIHRNDDERILGQSFIDRR
ncbi:MAG: hypothetical protein CME26_00990 [Gemmatimonadetes bacterium]|nr:hypothetical protein [Gemmatimonadota bacterium]